MPEHAQQRHAAETSLESSLLVAFGRASSAGAAGIAGLFADVREAIEQQTRELFTIVFILWLMQDDELEENAPAITQAASQRAAEYSAGRATSVARGFADNLAAEVGNGGTLAQLLSTSRAQAIAITETTTTISAAEQSAANSLGDIRDSLGLARGGKATAYWATERDEKVCPLCFLLNNQPEPEWVDTYPTGPPAHPRCRCYLIWDVTDVPESLREAFDESKHPRGDNGRFVATGDISAAIGNPAKEKALRARVTDPKQRGILDRMLAGKKPIPERTPRRANRTAPVTGQRRIDRNNRERAERIAAGLIGGKRLDAGDARHLAQYAHRLDRANLAKVHKQLFDYMPGNDVTKTALVASIRQEGKRIAASRERQAAQPAASPHHPATPQPPATPMPGREILPPGVNREDQYPPGYLQARRSQVQGAIIGLANGSLTPEAARSVLQTPAPARPAPNPNRRSAPGRTPPREDPDDLHMAKDVARGGSSGKRHDATSADELTLATDATAHGHRLGPHQPGKLSEYGPPARVSEVAGGQQARRERDTAMAKMKITASNARALIGAPANAQVEISYNPHAQAIVVQAAGTHPDAGEYTMTRTFSEHNGQVTVHHDYFRCDNQGGGFGREVFAAQVQAYAAQGYRKIETYAAGDGHTLAAFAERRKEHVRQHFAGSGKTPTPEEVKAVEKAFNKHAPFNGFLTWPKFGYDAQVELARIERSSLTTRVPPPPGVTPKGDAGQFRLKDLMKSKEGQEWWAKYGHGADMTFDLRAGSLSRRTLDKYLDKKSAGK